MPITLHWFLPTTGDARGILGAGTVVGAGGYIDLYGL